MPDEGERTGGIQRPASNIVSIARRSGPTKKAVEDFKRVCDQMGVQLREDPKEP